MDRPFVRIEWADAHAHDEDSWVYLSNVPDRGEYLVSSIGHLLALGDGGQTGHVSIAQSIGVRDDAGDHIIHIPVGMVRNLWVLKGRPITLEKLLDL